MKRFIICRLSFIIILALCASCNPLDKISVVSAGMPRIDGTTAIEGEVVVKNDGGQRLTVEKATLVVRYRQTQLATAHLASRVSVPARKTSTVRYNFMLENVSRANLQALALRALTSPAQITVDIEAHMRVGNFRKKVEIKAMPMSKIITNFGR